MFPTSSLSTSTEQTTGSTNRIQVRASGNGTRGVVVVAMTAAVHRRGRNRLPLCQEGARRPHRGLRIGLESEDGIAIATRTKAVSVNDPTYR